MAQSTKNVNNHKSTWIGPQQQGIQNQKKIKVHYQAKHSPSYHTYPKRISIQTQSIFNYLPTPHITNQPKL